MDLNLSIIVVTYNCENYIVRFLEELTFSLKEYSECEILINDNNSTDNTYNLCVNFKNINETYIEIYQSDNIGFAKANNFLIKKGKYKNILLLNPDVFDFYSSFWDELMNKWDHINPLLIRLLNTDGTVQETVVEELSFVSELKRFFKVQKKFLANTERVEVESGIMAFFLTTKECLNKVGGISEKYYMFSEDRDFCYKARKNRYKLVYDATLFLTHVGGSSANKKWNSRELLLVKNASDKIFIMENYTGFELYFLLFTNTLRKFLYIIKTRGGAKSAQITAR